MVTKGLREKLEALPCKHSIDSNLFSFNRLSTKYSYTWNFTYNTESTAV